MKLCVSSRLRFACICHRQRRILAPIAVRSFSDVALAVGASLCHGNSPLFKQHTIPQIVQNIHTFFETISEKKHLTDVDPDHIWCIKEVRVNTFDPNLDFRRNRSLRSEKYQRFAETKASKNTVLFSCKPKGFSDFRRITPSPYFFAYAEQYLIRSPWRLTWIIGQRF